MSGTRRRRLPHLTINRLVPNGLTLLSLCAGLTAVISTAFCTSIRN